MPTQDTTEIKEKILSILRQRGPSLPVHVSKDTGISMLFSSAFLSELIADKKVKISNMRVGGSPLYFISGQEPELANFSQHLNHKEREAFELLKEKSFLKDSEQQPAIRVALRAIKDFAIPINKNNELYWKYLTAEEKNFESDKKEILEKVEKKEEILETTEEETELPKKIENIFEEKTQREEIKKQPTKRSNASKPKKAKKQDDKFFNKIKEFVSEKKMEITGIEGISKSELILKINTSEGEKIIIAYNKKRITDEDIIKAHKKAEEFSMPFIIVSLGEPLKKTINLIEAVKKLEKIEKIN